MMFFDGNIGAPPTSTVISAEIAGAATKRLAQPIAAAMDVARTRERIVDIELSFLLDADPFREDANSYEWPSQRVSSAAMPRWNFLQALEAKHGRSESSRLRVKRSRVIPRSRLSSIGGQRRRN